MPVLPACMCVRHVYSWYLWGQRQLMDPLELELQITVRCLSSLQPFHLIIWGRIFHQTRSLWVQPDWLSSEALGSTYFCLSGTGITDKCQRTQLLTWVIESKLGFPVLVHQALQLNYLCGPPRGNFKCEDAIRTRDHNYILLRVTHICRIMGTTRLQKS